MQIHALFREVAKQWERHPAQMGQGDESIGNVGFSILIMFLRWHLPRVSENQY
jgi:hypothetical protein